MSRNVTLFCILICIHVSFSHDFTGRNLPKGLKVRYNQKHNADSQVVQLDMESFMSSDDPQDYEPFDFNLKLNRGTQNEDYYDSPINTFKREENADYSNLKGVSNGETVGTLKHDRPLNVQNSDEAEKIKKVLATEEREAANIPVEKRAVQDPKKKCLFRKMKIPFFSHKTAKQLQRRKLECMNCGDLYTNDPELQANVKVNQLGRRLNKVLGNVCPNCIRNLLQRYHKKQLTNPVKPDLIHDSKELNEIMATTESRGNEKKKYSNGGIYEYFTSDEPTMRDEDRERVMKELAKVEMNIRKM